MHKAGPHFCFVKITEHVRKYDSEHGAAEKTDPVAGMVEKSEVFFEKGAEIYAKA